MNLFTGSSGDADVKKGLVDGEGEGEGWKDTEKVMLIRIDGHV